MGLIVPHDSFGSRLFALRRRAGLTLTALALACGISRQQLTKYEGGKATPNIDALPRLAAALGCEQDDLLPKPSAD